MVYFKYRRFFAHSAHRAFDATYMPGQEAPYSGIYRCASCGHEVISSHGEPLPPQNTHQHQPWHRPIRWWLIAGIDHQ